MEATIKKVENGFEVTFVEEGKEAIVDVFTELEAAQIMIAQRFNTGEGSMAMGTDTGTVAADEETKPEVQTS